MSKIILTISLVLIGLGSTAQFKFGLEAGLNFSTWFGSVKNYDYRMGFYAGGKAIYYMNDEMLLQSGIYFSREGWDVQEEVNNEEVTQTLRLDYLVIPFDFGVFAVGDRYRGLKFNFGFDFKHLLEHNLVNELSAGKQPTELEVELNNFDMAAKIGMDYKIDESIAFSLLVYLGMFKVNKTVTPNINSMYNQGFKIGIYYML